jgi:integrase
MKILSRTTRKINGNWYARVRYEDDNGKKAELLRRAKGKSDAANLKAKLVTELLEKGPTQLVIGKVTFRQLVQHAKDNIYVPAIFDEDGTRIKGVKSEKPAHYALNALLKFYGDKDIRKIDADALRDYKVARLMGTNKLSKVKLATVHRELSKLRRLFNVAVGKGWLVSSPFTKEVSRELIQEGDETPSAMSIRELSDDEAKRVMTALDTPERRHTLPLFIAALDTGARKSSLVDYLKWKDIRFDEELIVLTAYKGKHRNKQCWPVPMTNRVKMELLKLQLRLKHNNPDALVFEEAKVNLRKIWLAAYAEAGVPKGVRMFYSVRHAYATDMANKGMELPELARLLGHSDVSMSYRYYNLTKGTLDKARNILNRRAVVNR